MVANCVLKKRVPPALSGREIIPGIDIGLCALSWDARGTACPVAAVFSLGIGL